MATFNTELAREGPGLLLRDTLSEDDPQVESVARLIARATPDIIALQGIDYDHDLIAARALVRRISAHGHDLPHVFALRPNTGMTTGLDLDGDGRKGRPRDAQGYGTFAGQGGMAILSRFPVLTEDVRDFSGILWRDMPQALLRLEDGTPLLLDRVKKVQRLSTVGHWVVPVRIEDQTLRLLTFHASPPVFDGPEDRNGRRNHDEIVFWLKYLDGAFGAGPEPPFVLAGDANLDPVDGAGRKAAIRRLLADGRMIDPKPMRPAGVAQGDGHDGDPRLDTVDWPGPDPGSLRVSYVLPSADLEVLKAGIVTDGMNGSVEDASRHGLVWVDLLLK
ncbi:endonuclease/exonuclease/phosphatase family protein [Roseovarius atlanticus]|uniref:endonuclease/exonuclease/phosphatase family protein n=1 Tax=Roseovarius atlanticus TaxID=1641875 RepID=UPI0039655A80